MSQNFYEVVRKIKILLTSIGVYNSDVYSERCAKKYIEGKITDLNIFLEFDYRIKDLEERIKNKLPKDYIDFIKDYNGNAAGYGEWLFIEDIQLATEYDIQEYQIIEGYPEILSKKDLKSMIPIYVDNDSYVLLDLRDNGKGIFVIWSDEIELGFQAKNFKEFKELMIAYARSADEEGRELIECNFFNFEKDEDID